MPVRFQGSNAKRAALTPQAVSTLRQYIDEPLGTTPFYDLLFLLCEVWDEGLRNGNCYSLLGSTKDQSTYTLTVALQGEKRTIYAGADLLNLLAQASALLAS